MKLLLDTHVALWAILNPRRLPETARATIISPDNHVRVSIASAWEIAIKNGLRGRPSGIGVALADALDMFARTNLDLHPLEPRHLLALEAMTQRGGDPFDRMIFAQAQTDGFTLMTRDPTIIGWDQEITIPV